MPLLVFSNMPGDILWQGEVDLSKDLQTLKAALHLIAARHTNPPILAEDFQLFWKQHGDGTIHVTYMKKTQPGVPKEPRPL